MRPGGGEVAGVLAGGGVDELRGAWPGEGWGWAGRMPRGCWGFGLTRGLGVVGLGLSIDGSL